MVEQGYAKEKDKGPNRKERRRIAAMQRRQVKRAKKKGAVTLERRTTIDEFTCEYCSQLSGTPIDDMSKIPRRDDPLCHNNNEDSNNNLGCRCLAVKEEK